MNSNDVIIADVKYQSTGNVKTAIKKWNQYVADPKKCDPTPIDINDVLKDRIYYSDNELFLEEEQESFVWDANGDCDVIKHVNDIPELNKLHKEMQNNWSSQNKIYPKVRETLKNLGIFFKN